MDQDQNKKEQINDEETGEYTGRKQRRLLEMKDDEKNPSRGKKAKKEIREWIVSLVVALVIVLLIRTFLFTVISVDGPSMQDTLYTGDRLIVTIIDVKMNGLNRFDISVVHFPNSDARYVKRVIGLPGETLEVRDGVTLIDGEPLDEPFLMEARTRKYRTSNFGPVEIPEGHYFLMGDNRDDSNDSRRVGTVPEEKVIGRARYIMWPFERVGAVDDNFE